MAKLVSKTYGDALYALALEKGTIDATYEEITGLKVVFAENEELSKLLSHPKISREEKITVIENIFKGKVSDDVLGFLVIVIEKDRNSAFEEIFDHFISLVKEYKGIGTAKVSSALPVSDEQKKKIEAKLLATTDYKTFEVEYVVDPSLIGGFVIRIGDRVVDGSVKEKIAMMAKNLSA